MPSVEHRAIKLTKGGLAFTWDDEKAKANMRKHGVSFFLATDAFFDDGAILSPNSIDEETGEERFAITGMTRLGVAFVVYVERVSVEGRDVIRIISARRAERKERDRYVAELARAAGAGQGARG